MNNPTKTSVAALVSLYALAGTPLAAYAGPIGHAIGRAIEVRSQAVAAPGQWRVDRDGKPLPRADARTSVILAHIGGNGG